MFSIREIEGGWEVLTAAGERLGGVHGTYDLALAAIASQLELARTAQLAEGESVDTPMEGDGVDTEAGLIPERWTSPGGIAFSEATGDGRDFTNCAWTWRDPAVSLLPLMLQTETQPGHFEARLAGFIDTLSGTGPVMAGGRFYDNDDGEQARDLLLGGRRFGVSLDPGRVEVSYVCTEEDEDGWCVEDRIDFLAYEIIGLTMTPFPAFAAAAITLEVAEDTPMPEPSEPIVIPGPMSIESAEAIVAAIPLRPPRAWYEEPEPALGDERLVRQPGGGWACPLTITDDGQVYGHLRRQGSCHRGFLGRCLDTPPSATSYRGFHIGATVLDDGEALATGVLVCNTVHDTRGITDREDLPSVQEVRDHYSHSGTAWASVRVSDGEFGPWVCGSLMPHVTAEQVRVLRAVGWSGDWREIEGQLELISVLSVTTPGYLVAREALVASGMDLPTARPGARMVGRHVAAMVGVGTVARCADCEAASGRGGQATGDQRRTTWQRDVMQTLTLLERRTRHLVDTEADSLMRRVRTNGAAEVEPV